MLWRSSSLSPETPTGYEQYIEPLHFAGSLQLTGRYARPLISRAQSGATILTKQTPKPRRKTRRRQEMSPGGQSGPMPADTIEQNELVRNGPRFMLQCSDQNAFCGSPNFRCVCRSCRAGGRSLLHFGGVFAWNADGWFYGCGAFVLL